MKLRAAAYVPDDDPERPWDDASKPLIAWLNKQAVSEGAPLLLTHTLKSHGPAGQNYERTTKKSRDRVSRDRPTFVYVPDAELLELGVNYARGCSIAVVESFSFPLAGWAAVVGAINLWTQEPAPQMPEPMAEAVDRLKFVGNNGFGDPPGKRDAKQTLESLRDSGELDADYLLAAVLGSGVSASGVKNLSRIMERLNR